MAGKIMGRRFIQALLDAGVVSREDRVRRLVVDAHADGSVVLYVERYGDERLLDVVTTLDGVQIRGVPDPAGPVGAGYGVPPLEDPTVDPALSEWSPR